MAFGDSTTAGVTSPVFLFKALGAGAPESYPFKLQALLAAQYTQQSFVMDNEGKAGEAAVDAVLRFPTALRASAPEVVILMHGVNDVSFFGTSSVRRVADYINTMARDARQVGSAVFVCTLPPNRAGGSRAGDPAVITAYNQALRDVARGEGAVLVDFEREIDLQLIGMDGLHPTEQGYTRMAEVLLGLIRARFEVTP